MKTITGYLDEIRFLQSNISNLQALFQNENRDPTAEERKTINDTLHQITELKQNVEMLKRQQSLFDELDVSDKPIVGGKAEFDENRSYTIPEQSNRDSFRSLGENISAIITASKDFRFDPRLTNRAASGMSETVGSEGGFLLQPNYASMLLSPVWENGDIPSRVNKITLTQGNSIRIPGLDETSRASGSRGGGVRFYWASEGDTVASSKPAFRMINLETNKLMALVYLTEELMNDIPALEAYIKTEFEKEANFMIGSSIIDGSGSGQPLGIMNAGCLIEVAKESGQAANTIVAENVVKMWARQLASSRPNSVWLINQGAEPQLQTMKIGETPIYMPPGGLSGNPYSTLMGRPVLPVEFCEQVGTKGDIILADFSQYRMIDKGGLTQAVSMHVRFVYDEMVLKFSMRIDGQPVLSKAITPYKGTDTLSHYVTLATRGA